MKNIVVAIDFSDITPKLVFEAILRAKAFSSHIWLVHVVTDEEPLYVKKLKTVIDQMNVKVHHEALQGEVLASIEGYCKQNSNSLVVIQTHVEKGFD